MNIAKYNDKCIRLEDIFGNIYEGIAVHNNIDFNECEYGINEESIQLGCIMFRKSCIKKIESLENHKGPFGKFSNKYGKLEEDIIDGGIDLIEEILESEENIHISRLLLYIKENKPVFSEEETIKLIEDLNTLIKYNQDNQIRKQAQEIIMNLSNKI